MMNNQNLCMNSHTMALSYEDEIYFVSLEPSRIMAFLWEASSGQFLPNLPTRQNYWESLQCNESNSFVVFLTYGPSPLKKAGRTTAQEFMVFVVGVLHRVVLRLFAVMRLWVRKGREANLRDDWSTSTVLQRGFFLPSMSFEFLHIKHRSNLTCTTNFTRTKATLEICKADMNDC